MRGAAARLGVGVMSLYRYVSGRDELIEQILEPARVVAQAQPGPLDPDPDLRLLGRRPERGPEDVLEAGLAERGRLGDRHGRPCSAGPGDRRFQGP
jgi:AcrR family transcriptional regulator